MKLFNGEKFKVITHFDTDGAGGPLLLRHCFGSQVEKVSPCGYGKITGVIGKNSCKNLIITDLSLTQVQINLVNFNYDNVIWFDHHETSLNLDYPANWEVFINTKACATKLIYLWLVHNRFDISCAKAFVDDVNDYDLWIHKNPSSMILNNCFWDISFWKFSKAFQNFQWNPELWKKARSIEVLKRKTIAEMETYVIEKTIRVTVGNKYVSDITLFYPEQEHHVILTSDKKMSIRSTKDLMNFYKELNVLDIECGGHKEAGGVEFSGDPMVVIELFYNYIKEG